LINSGRLIVQDRIWLGMMCRTMPDNIPGHVFIILSAVRVQHTRTCFHYSVRGEFFLLFPSPGIYWWIQLSQQTEGSGPELQKIKKKEDIRPYCFTLLTSYHLYSRDGSLLFVFHFSQLRIRIRSYKYVNFWCKKSPYSEEYLRQGILF
jgi:hypothetical protein